MTDPARAFDSGTDALAVTDAVESGEYVHVYRGTYDGTPVRVFTPAPDVSESASTAFAAAARQWEQLDGPGIVAVLASGDQPRPWLAVSAAGEPLYEVVQSLSTTQKHRVLADVAEALARVAREQTPPLLAPSLVRVVDGGESGVRARLDWPVARVCRVGAGHTVVSPYTPPELVDAPTRVTEQSAVYTFGAVAAYTLTEHPPVQADDLRRAIREGTVLQSTNVEDRLSPMMRAVVRTAMARVPADRYDSCYECKLAVMFDTAGGETAVGTDTVSSTTATPANEQVTAETADSDERADGDDEVASQTLDEFPASRRAVLGALGVGAVGAVAGGGLLATSVLQGGGGQGGARSFQYDSANTGHAPGVTGLPAAADVDWRVETGGSVGSSPAVVDQTVYIGSVDTQVYALRAADGSQRWTVETDGAVTTSPAVADGTVYLQTRSRGDESGTTYALDAETGDEQWTADAGGFTTPVPTETSVFARADDSLYALDPADGSEQWTAPYVLSNLSPALVDDTLYFGGTQQGSRIPLVAALDTTDGSERWVVRFDDADFAPLSSPAVVDGIVYIGVGRRLYAMEVDGATEVWSFETDDRISSSPAVTDDTVYIHGGGDMFYAVDRATGEKRWEAPGGQNPVSSPLVVGDTIYVGIDDSIAALDTTDGTERWSVSTGGAVVSSPAVADGRLYVGSGNGAIIALAESEPEQARPG